MVCLCEGQDVGYLRCLVYEGVMQVVCKLSTMHNLRLLISNPQHMKDQCFKTLLTLFQAYKTWFKCCLTNPKLLCHHVKTILGFSNCAIGSFCHECTH